MDWKTGTPGSANSLQLSIDRQAAAQALGGPDDCVEAAFYYVADQVIEKPENLLSLDQLEVLLSGTSTTNAQ